jgi:hypothetical protein
MTDSKLKALGAARTPPDGFPRSSRAFCRMQTALRSHLCCNRLAADDVQATQRNAPLPSARRLDGVRQSKSGVIDFLCPSRKVRKIKRVFLLESCARRPSINIRRNRDVQFDCGLRKRKPMSPRTNTVWAWKKSSPLTVVFLLVGCARWSAISTQSVTFNKVPVADDRDYNKLDNIEGRANGFRSGQQIVLCTKSEELWWVQPGIDRPLTKIRDDAGWEGQVHRRLCRWLCSWPWSFSQWQSS